MTAQGGHAGSTTDENHLGITVFEIEFTIGARYGDFVVFLEVEDVRGNLTRRDVVFIDIGRWRSDPDIEHDDPLLARIIGHGVGPGYRGVDMRFVLKHLELRPVIEEALIDLEVGIINGMGRHFNLNIAARFKIDPFTFGNLEHEFLNESGDVFIGLHPADPLAGFQNLGVNRNFHVAFHRNLTGQPYPFASFTIVNL